ncbi:hypothetical protein DSL92_06935 [Billgrantia gudaonensis]|uniref:Uncharacterized protein n=1 Tax=Billgrantia gudaonensis TaxID=376427 RepID=A0A432JH56_9GAMM|nr:hypothetical protein DSL92_06935 [Halomonas gudaonensis]
MVPAWPLGLVRQLRALKDDRPITVITADSGDDYSAAALHRLCQGLPPSDWPCSRRWALPSG